MMRVCMVALAAGLGLSGCALPAQPELADILFPTLTAGDTWAWRVNGTDLRVRIEDVLPQSGDFLRHEESHTSRGNEWCTVVFRRATDGAEGQTARSCEQGKDFFVDGYDPPCVGYFGQHPVGEAWREDCVFRIFHVNATTSRWTPVHHNLHNTTFQILGLEDVSTPAGTFEAWHIRQDWTNSAYDFPNGTWRSESSGWSEVWYAPVACHEIRHATSGSAQTELVEGHCATGRP